jgi:3-hydroxybutyryl-CoA dehydrogenase
VTFDEKLAVIGAGTIGRGIAQTAAQAGYRVSLFDVSSEIRDEAARSVRSLLDRGVDKGQVTPEKRDAALARLRFEDDPASALTGSALAVEAVPEDLALKKRVFATMERHAPPEAVLATNTSSLPVGEMAAGLARPERVVGMHFFNPVPLMPLLEIVRAAATGEDTVRRALDAGARMGKECIVVRDVPGFATSRLGVVLGLEAMRMLESGVASAEDIDKAMTLGYRHPVGPLKLTDLVGLDVRLAIAEHLHRALGSEAFRPPEILKRLVAEGRLGRKSGEGFYRWPAD